jgi:hypothetical protein
MDQDKQKKLKALLRELESDELSVDLTLRSMPVSNLNRDDTKVRLANLRKWIATLKDVLGEPA